MTAVAFAPIDPDDDSLPEGIAAELVVETTQRAADRCIRAEVVITNEGRKARQLHNPWDVLTYSLADAGGWPLAPAAPPSRLKKHSRHAYDPAKRRRYLDVESVEHDGVDVDVDAALRADTITLEPGGRYAYRLLIHTVRTAHDSSDVDVPGPGSYALTMLMLLRVASIRGGSAIVQSDEVPVTIV